ncbi:MAG: hypothetical protein U9O78_03045 [Patescibacteria group bacterium]|nr:hypothetical protein [Patescibacteria group bacterium]
MGQIDVYELLKELRLREDHRYFSSSDIIKLMKEKGFSNGVLESVRRNLISLEISNYLDVKMTGKFRDWRRLFRLKDKYVKG